MDFGFREITYENNTSPFIPPKNLSYPSLAAKASTFVAQNLSLGISQIDQNCIQGRYNIAQDKGSCASLDLGLDSSCRSEAINTEKPQYLRKHLQPPHGKILPLDVTKISEEQLIKDNKGNPGVFAVGDWKPGAKPLVLIHGIGSDFADLQPIIDKFKDDPTKQILIYAYSDLGEYTADSGKFLGNELGMMRSEYPWMENLDIIAHSMGGLVGKRALNELSDGDLEGIENFKHINFVAIDTPWHGFPGPGNRFEIIKGAMDMQAKSMMYAGEDYEVNDSATRKGVAGVKLPGNVRVNLLFADNEKAGQKRDGIKDFSDFILKQKPHKLEKLIRMMARDAQNQMKSSLSTQEYNMFRMVMQDSDWSEMKEELVDLVDTGNLSQPNVISIMQRFMPRFAGEHTQVLANPKLLEHISQSIKD